jgi:hypothetical protein
MGFNQPHDGDCDCSWVLTSQMMVIVIVYGFLSNQMMVIVIVYGF